MNLKVTAGLIAAIVLLVAVFFEVHFVWDFALPKEIQAPDPAVESRYHACFAEKDDRIHSTAFGTIDNPDVQREFISANRAIAERECRADFPETMVTVKEPLHLNLVDLAPRFW